MFDHEQPLRECFAYPTCDFLNVMIDFCLKSHVKAKVITKAESHEISKKIFAQSIVPDIDKVIEWAKKTNSDQTVFQYLEEKANDLVFNGMRNIKKPNRHKKGERSVDEQEEIDHKFEQLVMDHIVLTLQRRVSVGLFPQQHSDDLLHAFIVYRDSLLQHLAIDYHAAPRLEKLARLHQAIYVLLDAASARLYRTSLQQETPPVSKLREENSLRKEIDKLIHDTLASKIVPYEVSKTAEMEILTSIYLMQDTIYRYVAYCQYSMGGSIAKFSMQHLIDTVINDAIIRAKCMKESPGNVLTGTQQETPAMKTDVSPLLRNCSLEELKPVFDATVNNRLKLFVNTQCITKETAKYISDGLYFPNLRGELNHAIEDAAATQSPVTMESYLNARCDQYILDELFKIRSPKVQQDTPINAAEPKFVQPAETPSVDDQVPYTHRFSEDILNKIRIKLQDHLKSGNITPDLFARLEISITLLSEEIIALVVEPCVNDNVVCRIALDAEIETRVNYIIHRAKVDAAGMTVPPLIPNIPEDRPFNPVEEWHTEPYDAANFPRVLVEYASGEYYCGRTNTINWACAAPNALHVERWMFIPE